MTNKHEIITNDAEKIAKIPIGTYFIYESQGIGKDSIIVIAGSDDLEVYDL